ncbi:MAG: U32 family peptidase [Lachnospiraceae bacterium]|nr:U32 family peptidase [Lachnospiraceae bacterium]
MKKPELLAPAGSLEILKVAVCFGADAVYIGGDIFGLRAKAVNFTLPEIAQGVAFAHEHGVKVYVTANIIAHNQDLSEAEEYFLSLKNLAPYAPDALIISDPGVYRIAKRCWKDVEIHVSTQANNTNYETFLFWRELGAKRVVTARELSLEEIHQIRTKLPSDMEIESFVHGSMCISYSGRCLLSHFLTGQDANHGSCTHPCRWKYYVTEETRPGEYLPIVENDRGTFLFHSKDLCMIAYLPELLEAGVDSFKIEGRMKNALYVATVVSTYRRALDEYLRSPALYQENIPQYQEELRKCTHRLYCTGFYFGKPTKDMQVYEASTYSSEYIYLGIVGERSDLQESYYPTGETCQEGGQYFYLEQKNKFSVEDEIEILESSGRAIETKVLAITSIDHKPMESAPHARQKLRVSLSVTPQQYDLLRIKKQ